MDLGLPWVEKYRPQVLNDVVGQEEITKRLTSYVDKQSLPNMLFAGPAGVGKTSAAVALAKEVYGQNFELNFLELNASDERGIDVVRSTIKEFARTLAFNTGFKIIFLDESDALTSDAQQALRRTMEKYTKTTRFILSANYSSKLIEPLQSRCVVFRFRPLSNEKIKQRLKEIIEKEKLQADEKALEAIIYVAQGDLRKAINILQASSSLGEKITDEVVYNVSSRARPEEIENMLASALKGEFLEARNQLDTLIFEHGMSGEDVLLQLYRELIKLEETAIDNKSKIELIDAIGEANFRMVEGANERIQLEALLAKFLKYKK
jgi:replication factor C small subunit